MTIWPSEYRQWARQNHLLVETAAAVRAADVSVVRPAAPTSPLTIANPPSGATYLIDPTLRREFQTLPLRAVVSSPGQIEWSVDGRVIGTSSSEAPLQWPLAVGIHRVTARDERGHVAEGRITVK